MKISIICNISIMFIYCTEIFEKVKSLTILGENYNGLLEFDNDLQQYRCNLFWCHYSLVKNSIIDYFFIFSSIDSFWIKIQMTINALQLFIN